MNPFAPVTRTREPRGRVSAVTMVSLIKIQGLSPKMVTRYIYSSEQGFRSHLQQKFNEAMMVFILQGASLGPPTICDLPS
jgi:hypothetical protein